MAEPRYTRLSQRDYEVLAAGGHLRSRDAAIRDGVAFEYTAWGRHMADRVRVTADPKRAAKRVTLTKPWGEMSADEKIMSGRR